MTRCALLLLLAGCSQLLGVADFHAASDAMSEAGDDGAADASDHDLDGATADAAPRPSGKITITVPSARVGEPLTSFPLWLDLTSSALSAGLTPSGSGLSFFGDGPAGSQLPYQLVTWTPATGHLQAWVSITIPVGGTTFDVRWGDGDEDPAPKSVFGSGYTGVWHMDETAVSPTALADSSNAGHNGAATSVTSATGLLAGGMSFATGNAYMAFTSVLSAREPQTFSTWAKATTMQSGSEIAVLTDVGSGSDLHVIGEENGEVGSLFDGGSPSGGGADSSTVRIDDGAWHYIAFTYDGVNEVMYVDGNTGTATYTGDVTAGSGGVVGGVGGADSFLGILDEVRWQTQVRDTAWLNAEYANQRSPATFYSVGQPQPLP